MNLWPFRKRPTPEQRRLAALESELDHNIAKHAIVRKARQVAAERGHSTEIHRRAAQCRQMFGEAP